MSACSICQGQLDRIRDEIRTLIDNWSGSSPAFRDPLILHVQHRNDWFGFVSSPPRSFHAGVLRASENKTILEQKAEHDVIVVQVHTSAHQDDHKPSSRVRDPEQHPPMWHRVIGIMTPDTLAKLLRRPRQSWMIRDTDVLCTMQPCRRGSTLYRSLDDAAKNMWSQTMMLEAMERRMRLYEAVALAQTAPSKTEKAMRYLLLTRTLAQQMQNRKDIALDFVGHVAWHYLTHHSRAFDSLQAAFDLCESVLARLRLQHDSRLDFQGAVAEAIHGICACEVLASPDLKGDAPWQRAWNPPPSHVFKVPFDSRLGLRYLSRPRTTRGPELQSHEFVHKKESVTTKSFTVARFIVHGGFVYIPEFANIVHEASLLWYTQTKGHRVTLKPEVTLNFKRMVFDCYRQLMAWNIGPHFVELGDVESAQQMGTTDALAVRVVPRNLSIPDMYKALPPCMLPATSSAHTLPRDRTRIQGYARGRTAVTLTPRPHAQRLRQYIALSRFTYLTPEQISQHFGHNTRADIRMARDTSRMRQANLTCASMQSCGLCPYYNQFPNGALGRSPQHMCMDRIRSSSVTSSSSSTLSSSSSVQPDAADPDRVTDVKHAVVEGVSRQRHP